MVWGDKEGGRREMGSNGRMVIKVRGKPGGRKSGFDDAGEKIGRKGW